MSRLIEEAPTTTPEESQTGETVSAMLIRVPSFRILTVSAKSTRSPRLDVVEDVALRVVQLRRDQDEDGLPSISCSL